MTKEEFIRCGHVPFGFFAPPLSTEDPYPPYIREIAQQAAARLQAKQTEDCVNFLFMADIHYCETPNHDIRAQRMIHAIEEVAPLCTRVFLGGDLANDGNREYKLRQYEKLRGFFSPFTWFPVMGNHDDNSIWDDVCIQAEQSTNHLSEQELWEHLFDHIPAQGAATPDGKPSLYYLIDDPRQRVRYIVLNMCDIPMIYDEKGKLAYIRQSDHGFSQTQLDWLVNTALVLPEDGWDLVVFSHSYHTHGGKPADVFRSVRSVLDAFRQGRKLDESFREGACQTHVQADFSAYRQPGMLVCFGGHRHEDVVKYTEGGIPIIYIGEVIMYLRADGGPGELLMDAVTLDRKNRRVLLTRIGQGEDRTVESG